MNTLDNELLRRNINLDSDNRFVAGERTQKNVSRLIDAARKLESGFNATINQLREKLDAKDSKIQQLTKEVMAYRLKEMFDKNPNLSVEDKRSLVDQNLSYVGYTDEEIRRMQVDLVQKQQLLEEFA